MLNRLKSFFAARAAKHRQPTEQTTLEAWSLHFGREGAQLWLQALSTRDAARLSNA